MRHATPRAVTATAQRTLHRVGLLPVALALLCSLCFAQAAPADFVPAPLPAGAASVRTLAVLDQSSWAAHVIPATGPQRVSVTSNRGATWTDAAALLSAGDTLVGLAAAPAHTYRAVVWLTGTPRKVQVK